jgi:hypothetical protein
VFRLRTNKEDKRPKNVIAGKMREARRRFAPRMTQADLSATLQEIGVAIDRAGISKIETGERVVLDFELKAIGEALSVKVGWLLDEIDT